MGAPEPASNDPPNDLVAVAPDLLLAEFAPQAIFVPQVIRPQVIKVELSPSA